MKIKFLTIEEVKLIHIDQINRYSGIHGLRDEKLLDSAINYPQATFDKKYLHPDIYHMASSYMYAIIKNHPFLDGNKRTGLIVGILFLAYNDIFYDCQNSWGNHAIGYLDNIKDINPIFTEMHSYALQQLLKELHEDDMRLLQKRLLIGGGLLTLGGICYYYFQSDK